MKHKIRSLKLIVNNNCNCFCKMCDVGMYRKQKVCSAKH